VAHCQKGQLDTTSVEEGIAADEKGIRPLAQKSRRGRIDLTAGAGAEDLNCSPMARAADSNSRNVVSAMAALAGLMSAATRVAAGTNSRRSPSCFAANSILKKLTPVRLPPGLARLGTTPSLTGSSPTMKTTGSVEVAALAADMAGTPPLATITLTCRRTKSSASPVSRSN